MPEKRLQRTRDAYLPFGLDVGFPEIAGVYQRRDDGSELVLKVIEVCRTPDGLRIVVE